MVQSTAQRIDLIDENYTSVWWFSCVLEELSDSFRPNPNKHLLKLRSNHLNEATSRLIRQSSSKQGFPCSRRSIKHDSPPNPGPHCLIFLRIIQEINNLLKLLLYLLPSVKITEHWSSGISLRLESSIRQRRFVNLSYHILECQHGNRTCCSNSQQLITNLCLMYRKRYFWLAILLQLLLKKPKESFEWIRANWWLKPFGICRVEYDFISIDDDFFN